MNPYRFFCLKKQVNKFFNTTFFLIFLSIPLFQLSPSFAMEDEIQEDSFLQKKSSSSRLSINQGTVKSYADMMENEEEPLIKADIHSFLKWINKDVLVDLEPSNQHRAAEFLGVLGLSKKQRIAKYLGIGTGLTGCVVFYNLGKGLAEEILHDKAFGVITGVASAVPIAILGSQFCSHIFKEFVTTVSQEEQKITKKKGYPAIFARKAAQGIESVIAIISAAPITYLTNKYYYPLMNYSAVILDVPAFIAKAVSDYWAMDTTASMFVDIGKNFYLDRKYKNQTDSIQYKRFKLIEHLNQALKVTSSLNDQDAKEIYSSLVRNKSIQQDDLTQITKIFNPTQSIQLQTQPKTYSWGRVTAGTLGSIVGAFSSVCLVPLAEESMSSFFKAMGVHSPILDKVGGWIAGVAAGSLMTYTSKDSFEKFYDFFVALPNYCRRDVNNNSAPSKIQRRDIARVAIASGSLILSAYSSAPQAYLSEQYFGSKTPLQIFTLACAALGPFAMDFWAIDNYFKGFLDKFGPKEKMSAAIQQIQHKIPTLDDNIVEQLYNQIKNFH